LKRLDHPHLGTTSVHVWSLDLGALGNGEHEVKKVLSSDELERAQRFIQPDDRDRFAITRFFLRMILADYMGTDPAQLKFDYSPHGKPSLSPATSSIAFNVSHSHKRTLIAITHGQRVGIDVEFMREPVEIADLAQRFFSPYETALLANVPIENRPKAFFRIWTAKESFVKATGAGLSLELSSFDIDLDQKLDATLKATRPDPGEAGCLHVRSLSMPEGYEAAVSTEGKLDLQMVTTLG
jgi:4'-phosphopantetheinyl transferase